MAVSVGAVAGSTRVIGDYEIVRPLADRGGMAVVYVARQSRLDRIVALKEVDLRGGAEFVDRFVREARLAGSLNHPNVVTVFDFFERESVPYIAMEYLPQGSLRRQMRGLGLPQILGVLQGMLAGLDHAHGRGLVHRDVKPENVLVTDAGTVKVADFGLAFAYANASNRLTRTGAVMGTATYMSPEQAQNLPVGPRTDLYAVGVTAYEMLLGRPPFEPGQHPMALMAQHVSVPVPDPVALRPDLDPRIAAWLMRLLAKEPSARPASAVAAWEELEESAVRILGPMWRRSARLDAAIADEPAAPLAPPVFEAARDEPSAGRPPDRDETATPGLRPSKTLAPPRRRRRFVAAAGTLLLLLGAAGGAYGLWRVGTPRQAAVTGATGTPAENPVTRVTPAATATLAATATPAATDTPPPTATSASKTGADPGDTLLRGVPAGLRSMCQPPEAGGGSNAGPLPPGVTALAAVRCRGTGELRDLTAGVVEYFLLPSKGAPGRWLDLDARTFADGGRDAPHRPAAGACERFTGAGTWDERDWPRGRALCLWDDEGTQTIEWTAPEDHILARLVSVRPQTPVWRAQEQAAG